MATALGAPDLAAYPVLLLLLGLWAVALRAASSVSDQAQPAESHAG